MMRVFIEGVDGYVGSAVKRVLLADHRKLVEENEGGEDIEKLEIVGSVAYQVTEDNPPPEGVAVAVSKSNLEQVCELALTADRIVLDTHESVMQASAVVKALKQPFDGTKSLVLISTLLTWGNTTADNALEEGKTEDETPEGEEETRIARFSEDEFTRRKPSPSFLLQKTLESQVLALSHDSLATTVLASGLVYGAEECLFHGFFRNSWLGKEAVLPDINEKCKNVVPTVHVNDLARATCSSLNEAPSKQYVVVADESNDTVADIVTAIHSVLQPHSELTLSDNTDPNEELDPETTAEKANAWKQRKAIPRIATLEETDDILLKDPSWSKLQCNLSFDTTDSAVNSLVEEWVSREGIVAGIGRVVEEYRHSRDLRPIRVVLTGAPFAGKTTVAGQIAQEYALPIVSVESATKDLLQKLQTTRSQRDERLAAWQAEKDRIRAEQKEEEGEEKEVESEEKDGEDDTERAAIMEKDSLEKLAERVEVCIEKKGRLSNKLVAKVLRAKFLTPECLNQGYVLDSVLSHTACRRLYGISAITDGLSLGTEDEDEEAKDADLEDAEEAISTGEEGEGEEAAPFTLDPRICPTAVLAIDAKDETLRKRACEATGEGALSEDEFQTKLDAYRTQNAEHLLTTPLSFFERTCKLETLFVPTDESFVFVDDEERKPESKNEEETTEIEEAKQPESNNQVDDKSFENIMLYIEQNGRPFNYRPTEEDLLERAAKEKALRLEREELERKQRIQMETERKEQEAARIKALEDHREQVEKHEREVLEARAQPLNDYLLKHVMPTLSKGLVETCRVQPDDPIDFLSEYLFKNSAESESLYENNN